MESRSYKYKDTSSNEQFKASRSSRNSKLYQEVYNKYGDFDNLPIQDNTKEIDMARLKEMVKNKEEQTRIERNTRQLSSEKPIISRNYNYNDDNQKVHDINKLIEKAKYENDKLKEPVKKSSQINRNILRELESRELSLEEIKKECQKYGNINKSNKISNDDDLTMTREMKYRTRQISTDPLIEQVMSNSDDALDLFEDLKPIGNTQVTKPIKEEQFEEPIAPFIKKQPKKIEEEFRSTDTSDIDIIKTSPSNDNTYQNKSSNRNHKDMEIDIDDDFYTNSYAFSNKDFFDDDYPENGQSGNIIKIILLIIAIIVFIFVIFYFIKNYGLGV